MVAIEGQDTVLTRKTETAALTVPQELSVVAIQQDIAYLTKSSRRQLQFTKFSELLSFSLIFFLAIPILKAIGLLSDFISPMYAFWVCLVAYLVLALSPIYFAFRSTEKAGIALDRIAELQKLLPPPPLPFCPNCTLELTADSIFCRRCATPVKPAPTTDRPLR